MLRNSSRVIVRAFGLGGLLRLITVVRLPLHHFGKELVHRRPQRASVRRRISSSGAFLCNASRSWRSAALNSFSASERPPSSIWRRHRPENPRPLATDRRSWHWPAAHWRCSQLKDAALCRRVPAQSQSDSRAAPTRDFLSGSVRGFRRCSHKRPRERYFAEIALRQIDRMEGRSLVCRRRPAHAGKGYARAGPEGSDISTVARASPGPLGAGGNGVDGGGTGHVPPGWSSISGFITRASATTTP